MADDVANVWAAVTRADPTDIDRAIQHIGRALAQCQSADEWAPELALIEAEVVALRAELAEANAKIDRLTSRGIEDLRFSLDAAEARANHLEDALERIKAVQPHTIDWLRANGIVFDGPLGTDPDNWEHVAFSVYSDLCEADTIATQALDALAGSSAATKDTP